MPGARERKSGAAKPLNFSRLSLRPTHPTTLSSRSGARDLKMAYCERLLYHLCDLQLEYRSLICRNDCFITLINLYGSSFSIDNLLSRSAPHTQRPCHPEAEQGISQGLTTALLFALVSVSIRKQFIDLSHRFLIAMTLFDGS